MFRILRNVFAAVGVLAALAWFFGITNIQAQPQFRVDCTEDASTGFHANPPGEYKLTQYSPKTFSMQLHPVLIGKARMIVSQEGQRDLVTQCNELPAEFNGYSCTSVSAGVLNYNVKTGDFVRAMAFGHVFSKNDSVTISRGTCKAA